MNNKDILKPCPLCGGEAKIESFSSAPHGDFVTIKCTGCGLTLDWTTDYYYSNIARVHANLTATQAWNRRAKQIVAIREPRWIPVTERLPENDKAAICYTKDGEVLYWMPLPAPPTPEECSAVGKED